jgi:ABC-type transporter MlaC component
MSVLERVLTPRILIVYSALQLGKCTHDKENQQITLDGNYRFDQSLIDEYTTILNQEYNNYLTAYKEEYPEATELTPDLEGIFTDMRNVLSYLQEFV